MKRIFPMHEYEQYLSTFSAHNVLYNDTRYPTVEHAYHCQRYTDPSIQNEIIEAKSAYLAWEISQKYKAQQQSDWDNKKAAVMEELCRAKLKQHADVKEALLVSADSVIIKDFPDPFWGIGMDGVGQNKMGVIWMQLRAELK
jgi:ribA/ribD-fused uncharacterized protein